MLRLSTQPPARFAVLAMSTLSALSAVALSAALTLGTSGIAHAQTIFTATAASGNVGTQTAAFNAAAPGNTLYTFEDIAPSGSFVISPNLSPLSFVVTGGASPTVLANDSQNDGSVFQVIDGTDSISAGFTLAFSPPATTRINLGTTGQTFTAFATELGRYSDTPGTFTISLFLANVQVGTTFASAVDTGDFFFGATSLVPFDNVRVTTAATSGGVPTLFDNVRTQQVGAVAAAPEPGSLALAAVAALPMLGVVRRRLRTV